MLITRGYLAYNFDDIRAFYVGTENRLCFIFKNGEEGSMSFADTRLVQEAFDKIMSAHVAGAKFVKI